MRIDYRGVLLVRCNNLATNRSAGYTDSRPLFRTQCWDAWIEVNARTMAARSRHDAQQDLDPLLYTTRRS
jgi:hypothetical protein